MDGVFREGESDSQVRNESRKYSTRRFQIYVQMQFTREFVELFPANRILIGVELARFLTERPGSSSCVYYMNIRLFKSAFYS